MNTISNTKEFSLAQLVEEPSVGLDMEDEGLDRRTVHLLLELAATRPHRGHGLPHAPFVS
jgi:hypothetical protein